VTSCGSIFMGLLDVAPATTGHVFFHDETSPRVSGTLRHFGRSSHWACKEGDKVNHRWRIGI
jgi:hypothetical protein